MKKILMGIGLSMALFLMVGCGNQQANPQESTAESAFETQPEEITAKVLIVKDTELIEEKTVTVDSGSNLMQVMQNNFSIEEENGMITAISDIKQDSQTSWYWIYTINDEMVNTGAADTTVQSGDTITFTYSKF